MSCRGNREWWDWLGMAQDAFNDWMDKQMEEYNKTLNKPGGG
jgi:hypothetical protein